MASLKGYLEALSPEARRRYTEKIRLVDNLDPYMETKKTWSTAVEDYPGITYPDIVAYLLFAKSAYTNEELRNYKSLEAYNQFVYGWVRDISVMDSSTHNILVHGRVSIKLFGMIILKSKVFDSTIDNSLSFI